MQGLFTHHPMQGEEIKKELLPFEEAILAAEKDPSTENLLVTWHFPNQEIVQLLFFSPYIAEILYVNPALVFPEEGEEGTLYGLEEIRLFLRCVMNIRG